jgi:hypothetical protein
VTHLSFLLPVHRSSRPSPEEIAAAFKRYHKYLESVRASLPASPYEFAAAPWHYDHNDHRCPHDSWVESVVIRENSSGSRHEIREIEIVVRLLGAYHDGYLELVYTGVVSYSFLAKRSTAPDNKGHGDWLIDEIRLSEGNLVLHEIAFWSGSHWLIECRDIKSTWIPQANPAS